MNFYDHSGMMYFKDIMEIYTLKIEQVYSASMTLMCLEAQFRLDAVVCDHTGYLDFCDKAGKLSFKTAKWSPHKG